MPLCSSRTTTKAAGTLTHPRKAGHRLLGVLVFYSVLGRFHVVAVERDLVSTELHHVHQPVPIKPVVALVVGVPAGWVGPRTYVRPSQLLWQVFGCYRLPSTLLAHLYYLAWSGLRAWLPKRRKIACQVRTRPPHSPGGGCIYTRGGARWGEHQAGRVPAQHSSVDARKSRTKALFVGCQPSLCFMSAVTLYQGDAACLHLQYSTSRGHSQHPRSGYFPMNTDASELTIAVTWHDIQHVHRRV